MEAPLHGVTLPARPGRRESARPSPPPPGSVRGDPARQPFSFRSPRSHFVDVPRRCRDCGVRFVLGARVQKAWCEGLGLRLDGRASRCAACRGAWLREHGVPAALTDAARALSEAPLHPPAILAYARAAVASADRLGGGPLAAALAALSLLRGRGPAAAEALYWRGRCHEAAGRAARARDAYTRFLAVAGAAGRPLARDARRRLEAPAPRGRF